ncbi:uncharacterized protein LOC143533799 [Bidens hawaiensis]|uniref:uncharacterized protein LOC143533799 n=1 Tax=Bidens hawaiensis TaxID=980011 RepID=UPI00404AD540
MSGSNLTPHPPKGKENGSSTVQCPMLTSTNYTMWAMRMKVVLRVHKVWDTIAPGVSDEEKNDIATSSLFQSVPEALIMQIGDQQNAKAMWDSIKTRHLGAERVREARLQTLSMEFDNMKMNESDSIDNFAGKLSSIASKSAALGEVIDEARLVKKFLKCLPRSKYIQMVASLEQVLDLNKTGFEDVVGRLRAYEEQIREEDIQGGDQAKLLFGGEDEEVEVVVEAELMAKTEPLKEKGEAFESFKRFKALIETEAGLPMKTLRTDRGGEFTSHDFNWFCDESGIIRHLTAPYTPQQNGMVERRNRTLMGMVRGILKAMQVPNYMWGEAVRHSTFLINRVPTRALVDQTPYECFKKKKPIIEHVRVFGCVAYAKVDSVHLKKLEDRSRQLVYLGSETGSKAYRLYDRTPRKLLLAGTLCLMKIEGVTG